MIDFSVFFVPLMYRNWPISLTSNFDIANFWVKFSWKSNSFKMVQKHVKSVFFTLLRLEKSKVPLSPLSRSLFRPFSSTFFEVENGGFLMFSQIIKVSTQRFTVLIHFSILRPSTKWTIYFSPKTGVFLSFWIILHLGKHTFFTQFIQFLTIFWDIYEKFDSETYDTKYGQKLYELSEKGMFSQV